MRPSRTVGEQRLSTPAHGSSDMPVWDRSSSGSTTVTRSTRRASRTSSGTSSPSRRKRKPGADADGTRQAPTRGASSGAPIGGKPSFVTQVTLRQPADSRGISHRMGEKTPTGGNRATFSTGGQRDGGAPRDHSRIWRAARLRMRATHRGGASSTRTAPQQPSTALRSRASNRGVPSPSSSRT